MTEQVACAMKKGRAMSKLTREVAAPLLGIDNRTLSRYETPEELPKRINPNIIVRAMNLYGDDSIGLAYLEKDPVFLELLGGTIERQDVSHSAMAFECENEDDRNVIPSIRRWILSKGNEPLKPECVTEIQETLHATLMFYINIRQAARHQRLC